ncbi:MAG: hypothetical protein VR65_08055 [Desulfobulbaceae bacterium BRH_c16a]|nr:MAG: hypothetical protein VR65_08055 [Desulfobulbaceae bacterium BRH_c16a]
MKFDISIIIPSGRPDRVGETIQALEQQTLSGLEYDIHVVTPFADRLERKYTAVHVDRTDLLYPPGGMRNIGAAASSGDILAFIDDDCVPPQNWLSETMKSLSLEKRVGAVGCRVVSGDNNFWSRCADYCLFSDYQGFHDRQGALGSAAVLVYRQAFDEAGGFDEALLASEDWDFSLRLQENGWKCRFVSSVEVQHNHGRGSFIGILRNSYRSGLRSGLVVQERYGNSISWLAKLSISFKSAWLYWMLILPYASAVSLLQAIASIKRDANVLWYFPVMFVSRVVYHFGVWKRLITDSRETKN